MVSVIVPNYNHAAYLEQRLESILTQSFQDFELILLDDASSDTSLQILKRYKDHPKVALLSISKTNSGSPYPQWMKGIQLAKGDYVWIAESDDFCERDFLENMMKPFEHDAEIGMVFNKSTLVEEDGVNKIDNSTYYQMLDQSNSMLFEGVDFLQNFLAKRCVILNVSGVLFKKEALSFLNKAHDLAKYRHIGDWYLYIKVSLQYKVGYERDSRSYFRRSVNAFSNQRSTALPFVETIAIQNVVYLYLKDKVLYNQVVDHVYYTVYEFIRQSSATIITRTKIIKSILIADRFAFRRVLNFIYYILKSNR